MIFLSVFFLRKFFYCFIHLFCVYLCLFVDKFSFLFMSFLLFIILHIYARELSYSLTPSPAEWVFFFFNWRNHHLWQQLFAHFLFVFCSLKNMCYKGWVPCMSGITEQLLRFFCWFLPFIYLLIYLFERPSFIVYLNF